MVFSGAPQKMANHDDMERGIQMEQTRGKGLFTGLKKCWVPLVIISLLLVIAVLAGTLYTKSTAVITRIVGSYSVGPDRNTRPQYLDFQNDTYTFMSDGTYVKYGQYALLEEGRITFADRYIFRLTPAQGGEREIMLIDGVVYDRSPEGRYETYFLVSELPALYAGPEGSPPPYRPQTRRSGSVSRFTEEVQR